MAATVTAVLVPTDESKPLVTLSIPQSPDGCDLEPIVLEHQEHEGGEVRQRLLVRPTADGTAGLYAHDDDGVSAIPNVRATRLAMACGLFSCKLLGQVLLVRASLTGREDLAIDEVYGACGVSPDLRPAVQRQMSQRRENPFPAAAPDWLGNALQQNYHDKAVLTKLANVMSNPGEEDSELEESQSSSSSVLASTSDDEAGDDDVEIEIRKIVPVPKRGFVTRQPLCLHCRRPAKTLCPGCEACYFCESPRDCRSKGWTHKCLCRTWKVYDERRKELSSFPGLGSWTHELTIAAFQSSEEPYEEFLEKMQLNTRASWWSTELYGWSGGKSASARTVDVSVRRTFIEGFAPLEEGIIPPERRVERRDIERVNERLSLERNEIGMLCLTSWQQYYLLRDLPPSSVVALLCTFPLTVYYAILKYGVVPCTVARMLKRPLRIHLVGVEKEANFIDLFKEVGHLFPEDFELEITFVVRDDMVPPKCRGDGRAGTQAAILEKLRLCSNLCVSVVMGTYGGSLDPNFDCGGPPDMVIGLNAGLYAYESWRCVVGYLYRNSGIVGVFTDYNEYSGLNCASLGGAMGRNSLCVNPFRQPRAMPVYSMNLPQFCNGFLYVMNEQPVDES